MIPTAPGEVSLVYARHEFAYRHAGRFVSGKHVLDVGCGTGYGCKILAGNAASVLGVDHDESAIAYCNANYSASNVRYRVLDAEQIDFDQMFDVVISFQVIEHLKDAAGFLIRLKKSTRPGGLVILSTPNVKTRHADGEGNPFHFSEMSYVELRDLLDRTFRRFELVGIGYRSRSVVRELLQKLPFYSTIGRLLRRGSVVKKVAARTLRLTDYDVVLESVEKNALDLLAICWKEE